MGTAMSIPALLRSLGADPEEVLGEIGYDLKLFDDPENRLSLAAHNQIVSHCVTRTGCRHFGLLIGQQDGLHSFGLMGLLVKYSPDVGTALRSFLALSASSRPRRDHEPCGGWRHGDVHLCDP